jgi:uncharacterized protein YdeI (YjbR/CyaY-like superfamily)
MPASKPVVKKFEAVLERHEGALGWVVVRIPFAVSKVWGKRGQLRVKGEINGFEFRTSLFPTKSGVHFMLVNKKMQAGAHVMAGMKARLRMEPDTEVREAKVPAELQRVLRESRRLQKFYESLNYSSRRDIGRWVGDAKHAETRVRRAEQLAERMMQVMEAERELPPVMQLAMAGNPKAHAGWKLMTPTHRRSHLFGIFHYQNPESRARRLAKAIEIMVQYAEKREKPF